MKFTKMQGCGNDYVYVNCFSEQVQDPSSLAQRIADRHYGVGGDGLILIEPSERADAYMHMFNLDGSEGNMCGNGIRCVAKFIYDHGIIPADRTEAVIDTKSGLKNIKLYTENGKMTRATVDMGVAKLTSELPEDITVHGMHLHFIGIDVGNPHAVYFLSDNPELHVSEVSDLDFLLYGPDFETHPRFPEKVNSEFIRIIVSGREAPERPSPAEPAQPLPSLRAASPGSFGRIRMSSSTSWAATSRFATTPRAATAS